jgi:hypothetical protein
MTEALNDLLEASMNELLDEITGSEGDYDVKELARAYAIAYPYFSEAGVTITDLEIAARKTIQGSHSLPFKLRYAQKLLSFNLLDLQHSQVNHQVYEKLQKVRSWREFIQAIHGLAAEYDAHPRSQKPWMTQLTYIVREARRKKRKLRNFSTLAAMFG